MNISREREIFRGFRLRKEGKMWYPRHANTFSCAVRTKISAKQKSENLFEKTVDRNEFLE